MEIKIIPYGGKEYEQMVGLRYDVLRKPLGLQFSQEYLAKDKDATLIAAYESGEIQGCCILRERTDGRLQLQQMAVAASSQGKGTGRKLIKFAETTALTTGSNELFLHSRKYAAGFYEKLGYQPYGEEFEEVGIPHIKMKKHLFK